MARNKVAGRPYQQRNTAAGRNLRAGLKVLGKTWRRDAERDDHVLNWDEWTQCGLPRSATTIDRDMREGVPEERIVAYAQCLGITPETLISPKSDIIRVLGAPAASRSEKMAPGVVCGAGRFPRRYLDHNRPSYIQELYALMGGVYRMDYVLNGIETIHRCAVWFYHAEAYQLLVRGRFIMFGNENLFEANLFRWHNNLHFHYLCENGLELGYVLFVDPLRHNLIKRRDPFWIRGSGLTDRGLADNQPITFTLRIEKLPQPKGMTGEALWEQESEAMRRRPFIAPGEAEYSDLLHEILRPEELV